MATVRIGLAAVRHPADIAAGVARISEVLCEARCRGVALICTPETYLPGLRGATWRLPAPDGDRMRAALAELKARCREQRVAAIVGMEWMSDLGLENRAFVISAAGRVLGYQTKNQITPGGEARNYVPDGRRRIFRTAGLTLGIVLCHEGWRYPETVRWAAVRGAKVVFQPQVTGSETPHDPSPRFGESFYEKAMQCRAGENHIYFASVNQAMPGQNSHTTLVDPSGQVMAYVPHNEEQLLVADLDLSRATRYYARRFRPELYPERQRMDSG